MKKTVLFLMNGFGIEQIGSYNVYKPELMPNLDKYTQQYMFSSIESPAYNLSEGYRLFSTGSTKPLTYSLINNYLEKFNQIKSLNNYIDSIKENSKIQLFFFMEKEENYTHLKELVSTIKLKKNNPVYLHIVLTSPDTNNYKEIDKIISKLSYDFKECIIASIVGIETLKTCDLTSTYMNLLKNEVGEKWREISKKLNSLATLKIAPKHSKEMYMNEGFKLDSSDSFLFFNYEYVDLTKFISNITSITNNENYCSVFPIKGIKTPLFGYPTSGISMSKSLEKIEANALILTSGYNMPITNYYCNGLQNVVSNRISFTKIEESFVKIRDIIEKSDYDLIIIDYQIDNVNNITDLNNRLKNLDNMLVYVHDFCIEKKISLFISSLYGMKKEIKTDNYTNSLVDFSSKVPFIAIDPVFNKTNFTIGLGNTFNLANTVYTNINNKYDGGEVLIKKKGYITKMLKK